MPRVLYNEIFYGMEDENIQKIIKMLIEIIENELTPRQREMIKEYFFYNKKNTSDCRRKGSFCPSRIGKDYRRKTSDI